MIEQSTKPPGAVDDTSTKAFEILVRRHHRRLLAYAISILNDENSARDVVQDSFVVAHRRLDDFDTSKDFGAWMRGIVRNKCKEYQRARQRTVAMESTELEAIDHQHRLWDEREAEHDGCMFQALQGCLGKLPELLHDAVNLFYLKRQSGDEVARQLNVDASTIRKRLQRARAALGDCITKTLEASV